VQHDVVAVATLVADLVFDALDGVIRAFGLSGEPRSHNGISAIIVDDGVDRTEVGDGSIVYGLR